MNVKMMKMGIMGVADGLVDHAIIDVSGRILTVEFE